MVGVATSTALANIDLRSNCYTAVSCLLFCGFGLVTSLAGSEPPALTLQSIYHPDEKFDHAETLPSTHWIGATDSILLLKRKKEWFQVDLSTGQESTWPIATEISQRLSRLTGINEDQIRDATAAVVGKLKRIDGPSIVRIDKAMAMVSPKTDARWLTRDASSWKNPTVDPTGRWLGYTSTGDLYLLDIASGRTYRLTDDGSDTILDGILDWTYQEEIFGRGKYKGFWFSPDGDWLAMLRIDIGGVAPYALPDTTSERGQGLVRRYPKAGDPIPHASLWIWDLRQLNAGIIPVPRQLAQSTPEAERIISGVWWSPHHSRLVYSISDRLQSWRELRSINQSFLAGETNNQLRLLREESSSWVEPPVNPGWLNDGSIVWRSELPSGRYRLYQIRADGRTVTPLSPDDFHVRQFHVQRDGSAAIVTGNESGRQVGSNVYRIDLNNPEALTLLTDPTSWHRAKISPDGNWFLDQSSTPVQPPVMSVQATDRNINHVLERSKLQLNHPQIQPKLMEIPTKDGVSLPAMLIRPTSATAKNPCPVLVEVYGGPQAPSVNTRWPGKRGLYRELLARRGIATLVVDNRSSAGFAVADSWPIHRRVGEIEFADTMVAVDWLKQQSWVDADHLAIRGWSFGGFLTLYAMTHSDDFVAGVAGGSVSDWREYDAFYTERYMGLPSQNQEGYNDTSPVRHASKLHGTVLLIHGESDDNVHPSGTMRMAHALQKSGKDFQLMLYPKAAHGVTDKKQVWHMMQMIDRFLVSHLRPDCQKP